MKLAEIFQQLSYGELSQISLGSGTTGEINESNYDKILIHINLGLTTLFKRFNLREGSIKVELSPSINVYPLRTAYAESNASSLEPVKFIKDVGNTFVGDIHKVEKVRTSEGLDLLLNKENSSLSLTTPRMDVLYIPTVIASQADSIPEWMKTDYVDVIYRANHPQIVNSGNFLPETYEVELPYSHLEALLLFVASRVNNPIGLNNEFNAGNTYAAKFEAECQRLEQLNLAIDIDHQNDRLVMNGWV